MKSIQSRDNPFFRELARLASSPRQRSKTGRTMLDGTHLLAAYLDAGKRPQHVLINGTAADDAEIRALLDRVAGVPVTLLDNKLFATLSELKTVTGIISLIDIPQPDSVIPDSRFALLLEAIQDPGNLGTVLRTAAAAGCDAVFLSAACTDAWSPRVLRAGMGAHFGLTIHERADLPAAAAQFRGATFGTALHGNDTLYQHDYTGNVAFAFGNEGSGLSAELIAVLQHIVTIPMSGKVESLNIAAAAAVCLFESARQRSGSNQRLRPA